MIRSALIALAVIFLLLLNLANLFGMVGISGPVPAMIWFAISFCGVFYLYKFCGARPVAARIGIFAIAFVGGFFTSVLYYGFLIRKLWNSPLHTPFSRWYLRSASA